MHAVYKINPPKGELILREKARTESQFNRRGCALLHKEQYEKVRAYEKAKYIPE